jgi:hypothetical protein
MDKLAQLFNRPQDKNEMIGEKRCNKKEKQQTLASRMKKIDEVNRSNQPITGSESGTS